MSMNLKCQNSREVHGTGKAPSKTPSKLVFPEWYPVRPAVGTGREHGCEGLVTYRLVCGGRSGQLWGLPSSHGWLEVVVGPNRGIKWFLQEVNSYVNV